MTIDEAVANAAAQLEEATMDPNPDIARLKLETADGWLRLAELLYERERV